MRGIVLKRKKKQRRRTGISTTPRKISEMVWEFAGEYIRLGNTLEEKQNYLNSACSAWNIACNPPEVRNKSLDQYFESFKLYNTDASDEVVSDIRSDMEKLIENKLLLFPTMNKKIVEALITHEAGKDNIVIISARVT